MASASTSPNASPKLGQRRDPGAAVRVAQRDAVVEVDQIHSGRVADDARREGGVARAVEQEAGGRAHAAHAGEGLDEQRDALARLAEVAGADDRGVGGALAAGGEGLEVDRRIDLARVHAQPALERVLGGLGERHHRLSARWRPE
jgi:hypothetical protein